VCVFSGVARHIWCQKCQKHVTISFKFNLYNFVFCKFELSECFRRLFRTVEVSSAPTLYRIFWYHVLLAQYREHWRVFPDEKYRYYISTSWYTNMYTQYMYRWYLTNSPIAIDVTYDDSHVEDIHLQKNMKMIALWDVTQLNLIDGHKVFGTTFCLHLQCSTRHCILDNNKHSTSYRLENMKSCTEENFNHKNKDSYPDKIEQIIEICNHIFSLNSSNGFN
jgi:hypothetical protein